MATYILKSKWYQKGISKAEIHGQTYINSYLQAVGSPRYI